MLLRVTLSTLLFAAFAAPCSPQPGAAAAWPQAGGGGCALKPARSPALHGFRLGMTFREAAARFRKFPRLARFGPGDKELTLKDAAGQTAISASDDSDVGVSVIRVEGRYLARLLPADQPQEFASLDLIFLDRRLVRAHVRDWRSPKWKDVEGLKSWAEGRYALKGLAWRVERPKVNLPPGAYADFVSDAHIIECDGFTVHATCVGPPGPADLCDLSVTDPEAARIVAGRRRAVEGKERRP